MVRTAKHKVLQEDPGTQDPAENAGIDMHGMLCTACRRATHSFFSRGISSSFRHGRPNALVKMSMCMEVAAEFSPPCNKVSTEAQMLPSRHDSERKRNGENEDNRENAVHFRETIFGGLVTE